MIDVDIIDAIPFEQRLAGLFVIGATLASFMNLAIYRLAWDQRLISPWSPPPSSAGPRTWFDRLPIFGWLSMRREVAVHGQGFWIRPMLLELGVGFGLAALYWWEVHQKALIPTPWLGPLADLSLAYQLTQGLLYGMFLSHAILIALMLVASVIDLDEKTIPDGITVPGALLGLLFAAAMPWSLLPASSVVDLAFENQSIEIMHVASPNAWPDSILGNTTAGSLLIALSCYTFWCFLLLPRMWYGRRGIKKALQFFFAKLAREPGSRIVLGMWIVGSIGIALMWSLDETRWAALTSSLIGMAVGGGTIWVVRLVGYAVLRREAMGFGDVTLMSMIGAFVGWQAATLIFFMAPGVALLFGIINLLLKSDNEIPYGPFLCAATLAVLLGWPDIWHLTEPYFSLGIWIPILLGLCLGLLIVLLMGLQLIKRIFLRRT